MKLLKYVVLLLLVGQSYAQTTQLKYTADEGTWISVDVSPDGQRIAFDLLGHLYEMPVSGGTARRLTNGTSWNMFPRYNGDGSKLLYTSDAEVSNDLWVMNRADGKASNVSKMKRPVFQGTWSKDDRHVYGTGLNMKVRFPAYQFNFHGTKQLMLPAGGRTPVNHFNEHPNNGLIYYVHNDESLPRSGPRVKTFNTKTGETQVYIERPGGAGSIRLSPDGKFLAYVHRDDTKTVLVLHELATRRETVLTENLDYGRFESRGFYGAYPNIAWNPNGTEVFVSLGGKIHAINAVNKADRIIPFSAPVERELKETIRFKVGVPEGKVKTQAHRWGQRTPYGVMSEALGDIYINIGNGSRNLTESESHASNPVYDPRTREIYYASWDDKSGGAIYRMHYTGTRKQKWVSSPTQYGSIAVSNVDRSLAFVRGAGSMMKGTRLENQTDFELMLLDPDKKLSKLATINWTRNRYAKRPPAVRFSPDGNFVYYSDYKDDKLTVNRVNRDGLDKQTLFTFTNATRAVISPDFKWIAFREYHRTFVTPFEFVGKPMTISAADKKGFTVRVDQKQDGDFTEWSADGKSLEWT